MRKNLVKTSIFSLTSLFSPKNVFFERFFLGYCREVYEGRATRVAFLFRSNRIYTKKYPNDIPLLNPFLGSF